MKRYLQLHLLYCAVSIVPFHLRYINRNLNMEQQKWLVSGRCWWAAIIAFIDVPAVNRACSWCLLRGEPSLSRRPARLLGSCCLLWPLPVTTDKHAGQSYWHPRCWRRQTCRSVSLDRDGAVYLDEPAPAVGLLGNHFTAVKGRIQVEEANRDFALCKGQVLRQSSWACSTTTSPQVAPTSLCLQVCTPTATGMTLVMCVSIRRKGCRCVATGQSS